MITSPTNITGFTPCDSVLPGPPIPRSRNKRQSTFPFEISALLVHEIRNPLASLELFAGLMEEDPGRSAEWLSHLHAGIRSLSGIVNNVLAIHSDLPSPGERLDAAVEIKIAAEFMRPLAAQARLRLQTHLPTDSLAVRCNRSAFHQILFNLCANAFRHTPAGGSVDLRCLQDPAHAARVHIVVSDTGEGIAPEHIPYLFNAGFSGSGTTSGLGLAVCKQLLTQQGGRLAVQSQPMQGSIFTVELSRA